MTRRDLLQNVSILLGGSIVGGYVFSSSGCRSTDDEVNVLFSKRQIDFLNEIADTILPPTGSPGAKAANVGNFMSVIVFDCYDEGNQKIFLQGMKKIDELSKQRFYTSFVKASPAQRTELLTALDKEQKDYQDKKGKEEPSHYFRMMKELCVLGYFNSKEGVTQALRYLPVPGKYDGSYPYHKGDKAWAT